MGQPACPNVILYICGNCVPQAQQLPGQWTQDGAHVLVRQIPCSGKMDAQYLLSAFEGGIYGLGVVACPKGQCQLAQGNYRAEVRIRTVQRLLAEIGLESERAVLLHFSPDDSPEQLEQVLRDMVQRLCTLGPTPLAKDLLGESAPGPRPACTKT